MSKTNKPLGYILVLLVFLVLPLTVIFYGISLGKDKSVMSWNPNVEDKEKINRTLKRGTIASMLMIVSGVIQVSLRAFGGSKIMLLLLYGFFMANVVGFMTDQGFGTDNGFSLGEIARKTSDKPNSLPARINGLAAKLRYVFGTLTTASFWRFIVTVFLDLFISAPIQSIIVAVSNPGLMKLKNTIPAMPKLFGKMLKFITFNMDSLLQSFVAFITFLAYSNDVRFKWAYPGADIDANLLIPTPTVKLATAIAGVVFLIANVSADFDYIDGVKIKTGKSLVDRLDRKLLFVLVMIALLSIGSASDNSFLNYSNRRYTLQPLQNYKTNDFWNYNREINKEIDNHISEENKKDYCKNKKIGYLRSCAIDAKTGNIVFNKNNIQELENVSKNRAENLSTIKKQIEEQDWEKPRPCLIPDHDYLCQCEDYDPQIRNEYGDYIDKKCKSKSTTINKETFNQSEEKSNTNKDKLNKYNGNFVKKIDMGIYLTHSSNSENKYDIIKKSNSGFGILCLYIFIGIVVPFIPSNFIYEKSEFKNAKLSKMIIIAVLVYGLVIATFLISKKCPKIIDLVASEEKIIKENSDLLQK